MWTKFELQSLTFRESAWDQPPFFCDCALQWLPFRVSQLPFVFPFPDFLSDFRVRRSGFRTNLRGWCQTLYRCFLLNVYLCTESVLKSRISQKSVMSYSKGSKTSLNDDEIRNLNISFHSFININWQWSVDGPLHGIPVYNAGSSIVFIPNRKTF